MKLSFVLIIYRSNSSTALNSSLFCEKFLNEKNIKSHRLESDFKNKDYEGAYDRALKDFKKRSCYYY